MKLALDKYPERDFPWLWIFDELHSREMAFLEEAKKYVHPKSMIPKPCKWHTDLQNTKDFIAYIFSGEIPIANLRLIAGSIADTSIPETVMIDLWSCLVTSKITQQYQLHSDSLRSLYIELPIALIKNASSKINVEVYSKRIPEPNCETPHYVA